MLSEFNSPVVGSGWRSTRYAATPPETLVPSWYPVTFQSNESSKFSSVWPKSKSFAYILLLNKVLECVGNIYFPTYW